MKILITGYRGFIGSNLVNILAQRHTILTYEWGDEILDLLDKTDCVMHIGAISSTTERNVEKIMLQNYDFSCDLLDMCLERNVHFQYSSSASIYGLNRSFTETAPVDPRTPYAWSKYMFEKYAEKQSKIYKDSIIQGFRYFNVYGNNEEHKGHQASPFTQFSKQARDQGHIKVFENSENYLRDFIPVEKIADYHEKFLSVKESGIWNLGSGAATSFMSVAEKFSVPIKTIPMPDHLCYSYQTYTCADMNKTQKTLEKWQV